MRISAVSPNSRNVSLNKPTNRKGVHYLSVKYIHNKLLDGACASIVMGWRPKHRQHDEWMLDLETERK